MQYNRTQATIRQYMIRQDKTTQGNATQYDTI